MATKPILGLLVLLLVACGHAGADDAPVPADVETFPFGPTAHPWRIVDPVGGAESVAGAQVSVDPLSGSQAGDALCFAYRHAPGHVPVLFHPTVVTTGLTRLSLRLRSERAAILALALTDRDGARFHRPISVPAATWTDVVVTPEDLRPNADSPVKRAVAEPGRLGAGLALFDVGLVTGEQAPNTIWIDALRVERAPIRKTQGTWRIDGEVQEVTSSLRHDGPIEVVNGGRLRVRADRLVLAGDLRVEGGVVEIEDTLLVVPQRYRTEFDLTASDGATLRLGDVDVVSPYPVDVHARRDASVSLKDVQTFGAGFHGEADPGCRIALDSVVGAGEFLLTEGNSLSVKRSRGVLVWFMLAQTSKGTLALPDGESIDAFEPEDLLGMDLEIEECRQVSWGLVAPSGCEVIVRGSELLAAGLLFTEPGPSSVKGLQSHTRYEDFTVALPDRRLRFVDATVGAWNLYAAGTSRLVVEDCLIGELLAFHHASVEVDRTTCDGTGGFLGSLQDASIVLRDCRLDCDLNAYGSSRILLERCVLAGNAAAADDAEIRLKTSEHRGALRTFGNGRIVDGD